MYPYGLLVKVIRSLQVRRYKYIPDGQQALTSFLSLGGSDGMMLIDNPDPDFCDARHSIKR